MCEEITLPESPVFKQDLHAPKNKNETTEFVSTDTFYGRFHLASDGKRDAYCDGKSDSLSRIMDNRKSDGNPVQYVRKASGLTDNVMKNNASSKKKESTVAVSQVKELSQSSQKNTQKVKTIYIKNSRKALEK